MRVESRPGQGTSLLAELPINAGQLSELRLSSLPEVLHVTPGVGDQADHR
jgi:hypothetical protein